MTLHISSVFTYDEDAGNYIQAVEAADEADTPGIGALEPATRQAINNFVVGCKQDGIWNAIKASCILAGARTRAGALIPLRNEYDFVNNLQPSPPQSIGFVDADYDRKTGLIKNATSKYLDSNRNNSAEQQNNNHITLYSAVQWAVGNGYYYAGRGGDSSGGRGFRSIVTAEPVYSVRSRAMSVSLGSFNITRSPGLMGTSREDPSQAHSYADKQLITNLTNSSTPLNGTISIFANDNDPTNGVLNLRLAFYSIGEALDLAKLDGRVTDLITAFGVAIP